MAPSPRRLSRSCFDSMRVITRSHPLTHLQCDEQHPVCKNCIKSKRQCLGYDPIFKQQSGQAQIQPSQSSSPGQNSATPTPTSTVATHNFASSTTPREQTSHSTSPNSPATVTAPAVTSSMDNGQHPPSNNHLAIHPEGGMPLMVDPILDIRVSPIAQSGSVNDQPHVANQPRGTNPLHNEHLFSNVPLLHTQRHVPIQPPNDKYSVGADMHKPPHWARVGMFVDSQSF